MALRCQLGTQTCHTLFRFFQQPGILRALFVEDLQPSLRTFDEFQRLLEVDPKWNVLCGCFGLLQRVLEHLELGSRILSQHFESSFQLLNSLLSGRNDLFRRTTCWRIAMGLCWGSRAAVWIAPSATWSCCWCHTFAFPFCWWGTEGGRGPRMTSNQLATNSIPCVACCDVLPGSKMQKQLVVRTSNTTFEQERRLEPKWLEPKWLEVISLKCSAPSVILDVNSKTRDVSPETNASWRSVCRSSNHVKSSPGTRVGIDGMNPTPELVDTRWRTRGRS